MTIHITLTACPEEKHTHLRRNLVAMLHQAGFDLELMAFPWRPDNIDSWQSLTAELSIADNDEVRLDAIFESRSVFEPLKKKNSYTTTLAAMPEPICHALGLPTSKTCLVLPPNSFVSPLLSSYFPETDAHQADYKSVS